ncbi:unnamed protein product [Strongylus vulgaris]|uniref:Major facilitator superfamily (MFS) profile domain-containing protein n=1 Tax=Strongylus vulgaris TaxID=40348 RepID=A0A3P7I823_STRVU|nr:unnamed protein product [Strongylus vulgaris]
MEKLSGSLYWNNTIFGVIRWGVNILVGVGDYFCKCVGRKVINFVAMASIIAALAVICGLYFQAVRNIANSALSVASRIGTIFAPQLFYLADVLPVLPYVVLLLLSFIDCICFQLFLPETKGRNLENHLPPKNKRIFNRKRSILGE